MMDLRIYISAAQAVNPEVIFQQPDGQFTFSNQPAFSIDSMAEDIDAALFDAVRIRP